MATNNLINSIDLDLTKSEIESIISDVRISIAIVIDSNHDNDDSDDLLIGDIKAKKLDMIGTSDNSDGIYKPINSSITDYPLAGEFVLIIETELGKFYLTSINTLNSHSNNIDINNIDGYVNYSDDINTNERDITLDEQSRKKIINNNKSPFNNDRLNSDIFFDKKFGERGLYGRFGNRLVLTADESDPEIIFENGLTTIGLYHRDFSYDLKSSYQNIHTDVDREITNIYENDQLYASSDRIFLTAGDGGVISETSGITSVISNDGLFLNTQKDVELEGDRIFLGRSSSRNNILLGNDFTEDFTQLMEAMMDFAQNLRKQDKIIALSNAANNFITDMETLGWDDFNPNDYLSEKVYVE